MPSPSRSVLLVVFLVVFLDLVGFGLVIPLLPFIARDLHATEFQTGLLGTAYSLMQFLFAPFWGSLSDRHGRRPILLVSLIGGAVAMALFAGAGSLVGLFVARSLAGLFNANIAAAQAAVADVTPPEERARGMGMIGAAFGLGFIFGPAIGGGLANEGIARAMVSAAAPLLGPDVAGLLFGRVYGPPLWFAAALGVANLVLAWFILPETLDRARSRSHAARSRFRFDLVLRHPGLGEAIVLSFAMVLAFSSFELAMSFFVSDALGFTQRDNGLLFVWIGVLVVLVQGGAIRPLTRRFGETRLLPTGLALLGLSLAAMPFSTGWGTILLTAGGVAVGNGLNTPSASSLISRLAPADEQGQVLGTHQSVGSLARIAGPAVGTFAYGHLGMGWPFWFAGGVMLLCAGAAAHLRTTFDRHLQAV